jgi:hypothetical protein
VNHKSHERREAHEKFLRLLCIFCGYLWFIDANGHEAGHLLYDAYGGVLTSTLTAELEAVLAGQSALADPATGLVHLGGGRWYDPALGRPLQPNPAGGVPTVPQSLNRYAATAVGQPGVAEAAGGAWNPFSNPIVSNVGKKALSVSAFEGTTQAAAAYFRASLHTIPGRPIWGNRNILVAANPFVEKGILGAGMVGLAAGDLIGTPSGSLRARLFGAGRNLFERAVLANSEEVTLKMIIGNEISYGHRLPAGRIAGWLAGSGKYLLDFGFGLGVDVGFQAWMDYGNPYLTPAQFQQRLTVAGVGSGISFGAGLVGLGAAKLAGLSTVGILGGPAGWMAIGVGITAAIIWDVWATPIIYDLIGANPERNLAPLQP